MKRIHESLNAMLDELEPDELNMVEDFIVNECDVDDTDENGNFPNLFRMFITYK
jgi:hypothetical protein